MATLRGLHTARMNAIGPRPKKDRTQPRRLEGEVSGEADARRVEGEGGGGTDARRVEGEGGDGSDARRVEGEGDGKTG